MRYVINGKFLSQKITGVQRYQYEIITNFDKYVDKDDFVLLIPPDADSIQLSNITVIRYGKLTGILWEQISFFRYIIKNKAIGINLGNAAPILRPDIICIHDMNVKRNPQFYGWKYRIRNNVIFFFATHFAKIIITVSDFSKKEIMQLYPKLALEIKVIKNSWQHYERIQYDENTLKKYHLHIKNYYFAMSSLAPNKNFKWINEIAKKNPNENFIIAGMVKEKIYGNKSQLQFSKNVTCIGYVTDSEAKTLMRDSKAFLFPSIYEGFGIPPLEALSAGAQIRVSDIPPMHEIFGEQDIYFDPYDYQVNVNEFDSIDDKSRNEILTSFNWELSARKLYEILNN